LENLTDAVLYDVCNVVPLSGPIEKVENVNKCFFLGVMLELIFQIFVNKFNELSAKITSGYVWFAFVPKDVVSEFPISGLIVSGV
jgi:hypothetical protein